MAKGIVAEQNGSNIEALTYYIQAKKNDKRLSEAASRASAMSTAVASGNFGAQAKSLIKMRNDWDKLLREAAELIASNPPTFEVKYFNDIEQGKIDYDKEIVQFIIPTPYLVESDSFLENKKLAASMIEALNKIPESKNWGEKINGFPWSYADDIEGDNWLKRAIFTDKDKPLDFPSFSKVDHNKYYMYWVKLLLLNANKTIISSRRICFVVDLSSPGTPMSKFEYEHGIERDNETRYENFPYAIGSYDGNNNGEWLGESSFPLPYHNYYRPPCNLEFTCPVQAADTNKLYLTVESDGERQISISAVKNDVLSPEKAISALESENHNGTVKIVGYIFNGDNVARIKKAIRKSKKKVFLDLSEVVGLYRIVTKSYIHEFSFYECKNLIGITFPSSVRYIESARVSDTKIKTVNFAGTKEQWDSIVFGDEEARKFFTKKIKVNFINRNE